MSNNHIDLGYDVIQVKMEIYQVIFLCIYPWKSVKERFGRISMKWASVVSVEGCGTILGMMVKGDV